MSGLDRFLRHQRANDLGSTIVNGHVGYGSFGFKHKTVRPAWATGSVVDTRAYAPSASVRVDVAEHDHNSCVVSRIVRTFLVMFALLTEFTILVPCVLREAERHDGR